MPTSLISSRLSFSSRRDFVLGAAAVGVAGLPWPAQAQAIDVGGAKFEPRVTVQGQSLLLNGAGVRYKAFFKVYSAGLYLLQKADTPEGVIGMAGPKRVAITMLREVDANELGKLFTKGMEENSSRHELSRLVPGLIRMGEIFASHKKLVAGETFMTEWLPGEGMYITVKDKVQGEVFKEQAFFNAILRIWLGKAPADHQLKEALLGKAS